MTLVSEDGGPYNHIPELEKDGFYREETGESKLNQDVFGMKYTMIHQPLEYAQFGISVVVQNNRSMMTVVVFQVLIVLFILLGIAIAVVLLFRVKKRMIEPMKIFSENLMKSGRTARRYTSIIQRLRSWQRPMSFSAISAAR